MTGVKSDRSKAEERKGGMYGDVDVGVDVNVDGMTASDRTIRS